MTSGYRTLWLTQREVTRRLDAYVTANWTLSADTRTALLPRAPDSVTDSQAPVVSVRLDGALLHQYRLRWLLAERRMPGQEGLRETS